jgi:hypothetical protein
VIEPPVHPGVMPTHNVFVRRPAWIVGIVAMAGCAAALLVPPIPQDPSYHLFADRRTIHGVPNFWNVVSNGAYLVVCIHALRRLAELPSRLLRPAYLTVGGGVSSSYDPLDVTQYTVAELRAVCQAAMRP